MASMSVVVCRDNDRSPRGGLSATRVSGVWGESEAFAGAGGGVDAAARAALLSAGGSRRRSADAAGAASCHVGRQCGQRGEVHWLLGGGQGLTFGRRDEETAVAVWTMPWSSAVSRWWVVLDVPNRTGLPPNSLVLEVTESTVMAEMSRAIGVLTNRRLAGVRKQSTASAPAVPGACDLRRTLRRVRAVNGPGDVHGEGRVVVLAAS